MFGRDLKPWFEEARDEGNPYLTEWFALATLEEAPSGLFLTDRAAWEGSFLRSVADGTHEYAARKDLVRRYAWGVPCRAALDILAKHAPLLEVGAGTGYWAWLLRKRGVEVAAYDRDPPGPGKGEANHWHGEASLWTRVEAGGPEAIDRHPDRTLFLCWPPYDDPFAEECLGRYRGGTLLFVGEGEGGCTGGSGFWERLGAEWEEAEWVKLPQFDGLHDHLTVWKRKGGE